MRVTGVKVIHRDPKSYSLSGLLAYPRLHVFPKGETLLQDLARRKSRPYNVYKKEVIPQVMEIMEREHQKEFELISGKKIKWSQYAGCSCPCSPGFIIESNNSLFDIFVDVEE